VLANVDWELLLATGSIDDLWDRFITVFTVFRLLTDFVCLYNYEF
jgi:hypothetical protein